MKWQGQTGCSGLWQAPLRAAPARETSVPAPTITADKGRTMGLRVLIDQSPGRLGFIDETGFGRRGLTDRPYSTWNRDLGDEVGLDGAKASKVETPMTAKHQLVMIACALILSAGVANAGPCNTGQTTGTGGGQQAASRAAQADQRQEHVQPSVAEQPKSTGKTVQSPVAEQTPEPSAKMTGQDRFSATPSQTPEPSAKMADQDC